MLTGSYPAGAKPWDEATAEWLYVYAQRDFLSQKCRLYMPESFTIGSEYTLSPFEQEKVSSAFALIKVEKEGRKRWVRGSDMDSNGRCLQGASFWMGQGAVRVHCCCNKWSRLHASNVFMIFQRVGRLTDGVSSTCPWYVQPDAGVDTKGEGGPEGRN